MTNKEFIERIGILAVEDMKRTGVLASVTIAQACLESGYGSSELATQANNLFGMKENLSGNTWESAWDGYRTYTKVTQEQDENGNTHELTTRFRKYVSFTESVRDHSLYLLGAKKGNKLRYEGLKGETNYKKAISIIKNGGYATDINYESKIISLIEKYQLSDYDILGGKTMKIYLSPSDQTGNKYSAGNTNEAAVCRKIAEAAKVALERNDYTVKLGANGTTYQQRVADSNAWGADVHVPIHTNAGGGDGTVVFAYPSSVGNKYVKGVYEAVANLSPGKDDGIRAHSGLYEINATNMMCVYVECEFHDNSNLASWIVNNTKALGEAIAKGFCKADGKTYKHESSGGSSSGGNTSSGKLYRVQVGAFSKKENAEKLVKELKAKGYDAFIK